MSFGLTVQEIYNLSKLPQTLEKSIDEFLKYFYENPADPELEVYGSLIYSKKTIRDKYPSYAFVNGLISENSNDFLMSLSGMSPSFKIPSEDTQLIVLILKDLIPKLQKIFETGTIQEASLKYSYHLEGINLMVTPKTYKPFLEFVVFKTLNVPSFLDDDMKKFIEFFVPKNILSTINGVISSSRLVLNENDYIGGYVLLEYINTLGMIDSTNIESFVTLKKYYTVRNSITKLSNSVFMVEDQELQVYLDDLYAQIYELSTLSSSKKNIEEILLLVLKTLNTRLDKNTKKLFSKRYDFDGLLTSFPDDIQNELLRLKLKTDEFFISTEVKPGQVKISSGATISSGNEIKASTFFYFIGGVILLGTAFLFLITEFFPNVKKIEFLCKIGMGRYAIHLAEKLVIKNANDFTSFFALAKALEVCGRYEDSINAYKTAMSIREKNHENKGE
jgi:hypothetical protein